MAARKALEVQWKNGPAAGFDSEAALNETYRKVHDDPAAKTQTIDAKGDAKSAFGSAAKTFKSRYFSDYGSHAQMEPLNAVARMNPAGDRIEVWEGTQDPGTSRMAVAKALGFKPEQVTHHQCYMGGGFGRRTLGDCVAEAARIAREVKRTVKLVWTREEDLQYGMFRPQSYQCLQAALDKDGSVAGWSHCVVGDGGGLLQTGIKPHYYGVPNQHIEARGVSHGIRLKNWRAVGHVFNVFAIESRSPSSSAMRSLRASASSAPRGSRRWRTPSTASPASACGTYALHARARAAGSQDLNQHLNQGQTTISARKNVVCLCLKL